MGNRSRKVLLLPGFGELPQWAVVGDIFPLGCAFDESVVHYKHFKDNPDYNNPLYNTKNGIYSEGRGLENVMVSWGHDDYMYMVAKKNGTTLPPAGLFVIRFHSFYALHGGGAYKHLRNEEDIKNLKWLQIFSKSKVHVDVEKVKPYYISLIEKCPKQIAADGIFCGHYVGCFVEDVLRSGETSICVNFTRSNRLM